MKAMFKQMLKARIYFIMQKNFSEEAACEKITYTHVLSKGRTEEKHYGKSFPFSPKSFTFYSMSVPPELAGGFKVKD